MRKGHHRGTVRGKRMLELGNQCIRDARVAERTGKEYFTRLGAEHISIDLNGRDGALKIDLSAPMDRHGWREYFDIVTNCGTAEHVEPHEAQYQCFKNIHDCLKAGGIAIHLLPDIHELRDRGCWKRHCNNYYSREFVEMLAQHNGYRIYSLEISDGMTFCCVQKNGSAEFMQDRTEFLKYITREKGGIIYPGSNDQGVSRIHMLYERLLYYIPRLISRVTRQIP